MRLIRFAPAAAAIGLASIASAQNMGWSDDFESYAAGSAIEGQGGWEPWDGSNQPWNTVEDSSVGVTPYGGNNMLSVRADHVTPAQSQQILSDTVNTMNGGVNSGVWTWSTQVYVPSSMVGEFYLILMHDWNAGGGPYNWAFQGLFDPASANFDFFGNGASTNFVNGGQTIPFDQWAEFQLQVDTTGNTGDFFYNGIHMYEILDWSNLVSAGGGPDMDAVDLYPGTVDTTAVYFDEFSLSSGIPGQAIGSNYCTTNPNSTGMSGRIDAFGSNVIADNDVTLVASQLPPNAFLFFLASLTQGQTNNPGGSAGNLCVGGAIGRYVGPGQIQVVSSGGEASLVIDLTSMPQPNGPVGVQSGETWNCQAWHRDMGAGGTATSNFTDGTAIAFQ